MKTDNLIIDKSFELSLSAIEISDRLKDSREFKFADQFLRSGTSIGANIRESQNAESRADFIHKLKISAKEANEHDYWLELLFRSNKIDENIYQKHSSILSSVIRILNQIVITTKRHIKN